MLEPITANPVTVDVDRLVNEYVAHLEKIATIFNDHARELGLGVRLDAQGPIEAVRRGTGIARVIRIAAIGPTTQACSMARNS